MWGVRGRPKVNSGTFFEVCRRRDLKINAGKSKVMVLGGEEKLEVRFAWTG